MKVTPVSKKALQEGITPRLTGQEKVKIVGAVAGSFAGVNFALQNSTTTTWAVLGGLACLGGILTARRTYNNAGEKLREKINLLPDNKKINLIGGNPEKNAKSASEVFKLAPEDIGRVMQKQQTIDEQAQQAPSV